MGENGFSRNPSLPSVQSEGRPLANITAITARVEVLQEKQRSGDFSFEQIKQETRRIETALEKLPDLENVGLFKSYAFSELRRITQKAEAQEKGKEKKKAAFSLVDAILRSNVAENSILFPEKRHSARGRRQKAQV